MGLSDYRCPLARVAGHLNVGHSSAIVGVRGGRQWLVDPYGLRRARTSVLTTAPRPFRACRSIRTGLVLLLPLYHGLFAICGFSCVYRAGGRMSPSGPWPVRGSWPRFVPGHQTRMCRWESRALHVMYCRLRWRGGARVDPRLRSAAEDRQGVGSGRIGRWVVTDALRSGGARIAHSGESRVQRRGCCAVRLIDGLPRDPGEGPG
jgi:hypothetical protein